MPFEKTILRSINYQYAWSYHSSVQDLKPGGEMSFFYLEVVFLGLLSSLASSHNTSNFFADFRLVPRTLLS